MAKTPLGSPRETNVAVNPDWWFSYLKEKGVVGIQMRRQPQNDPRISDRMSSGFVGGGGVWTMEGWLPKNQSELWQARWEVWNQSAPDRRIWRVTYGRIGESTRKSFPNLKLELIEEQFLNALLDIYAFSEKHRNGFTESFSNAIKTLRGGEPHVYHKDLAPPDVLPAKAAVILNAAQSAWVFGGMGSWNDLGFDGVDGKEYVRVSDQLFQALTEVICAATNASLDILE
jgi:hypothetical protein